MALWHHGGEIYGSDTIRLDYSVNINPLGFPRRALEALGASADVYERYPDQDCTALRRAIAEKYGRLGLSLRPEDIHCGSGASELFQLLVQAIGPRRAVITAPAFSGYEKALINNGIEPTLFLLRREEGFRVTERILTVLDDLPAGEPAMLFLCQPNNPVGNTIGRELMEAIAARCEARGIYLIVDECFLELTDSFRELTMLEGYAGRPHTIVVSAFTKIYAMPGLRLGFLVTPDEAVRQRLAACQTEWSVSGPAQLAGRCVLDEEIYLAEARELIRRERAYLTGVLEGCGFRVYPGEANFLFFEAIPDLKERLLEEGVLIRHCDNYRGLGKNYFRLSVGNHDNNKALAAALEAALSR